MSVDLATLLGRLGAQPSGKGWMAHCPAHADSSPSLLITVVGSNVWPKCFAGCSQRRIVHALEARELWPVDTGAGGPQPLFRPRNTDHLVRLSRYKRPGDVRVLRPDHRRYLDSRGFDTDRLVDEWGIGSTGPMSRLGGSDYRNRIFIPIHWKGREVSFTTRALGKVQPRYKSCDEDWEIINHKTILYTSDDDSRLGIAVEGPTDVWRLGPLAFATFGVSYTTKQIAVIADRYDKVAIVYDDDRQGQKQAAKLLLQLQVMGVEATNIRLGEGVDPGILSDDDARHLVREIQRWQTNRFRSR